MNDPDFLHHMKIIRDMLRHPHVRIILMHPPYLESQQSIIDSICRNSKKIIGQIERKPPIIDAAIEIERMILSHHEPFIDESKLQYVIIGRQSVKH